MRRRSDWSRIGGDGSTACEAELKQKPAAAPVADVTGRIRTRNSTGGQQYLPHPDGSFLAQSYAPTKTAPG